MEPLEFPDELLSSLRTFAAAEGTTLFMLLLAGFQVLLNRYTNRSDLVIGVPVANRNWLASETVMGTLVNTLALRTQFDPGDSFRKLLQQVRETSLDAFSHQDLPFERLVSELPVERRRGESPLISVMFDFQNTPMADRTLGPLTMRPLVISRHASQFDLSLLISDTNLGLMASVEYSTELFEAATIRRLLDHYRSILEFIVLSPNTAIARIPVLGDAERKQLLALGNQPCVLEPAVADALPGFARQVAEKPNAAAVFDMKGTLSYEELDRAATRLARRLLAAGAGPGERVAICLDRNRDLVIAILAALKSGTAYVPVDVRHPPERVALVLQDADVRVVLTETCLHTNVLVPARASVVLVDEQEHWVGDDSVQLPASLTGSDPAYLIYTSGSTGKPKGVEVSRGALANFLRSMRHTPGISGADRLLSVTTVAFDIAGLELLLPLAAGASVFVAPNDAVADPRSLLALLETYKPTIMQATPATWKMLLDADWSGDPGLKVLCGGEALPRELARKLLARCESLFNMYGPTETTIWSALHRVTEEPSATVPIGRPIDATYIYILDGDGHLVPRGVSGEIYIGGAGVANGYFRNPELTRERFVADPFAVEANARMYRTGDAGRWLANGTLEYLGRLDNQIKLRGFRIEPAEIEVAIKASGRVRDALVVARTFPSGDLRLVAYCLVSAAELNDPTPGGRRLSEELTESLSRKLPSYMIPSSFVELSEFPQTPNGKIDRKALPLPALDRAATEENYLAPRDEIEATLQTLWQDILAVERVGIRDNFFSLGGHSLLATRLFAAMERAFGVQLQLSLLFERSTIEYLAEHIHAERAARTAVTSGASFALAAQTRFLHLVPIQERGTRPRLFCVHGAGGQVLNFWALSQHLGPDQPFYALQAPGVDGRQSPYEQVEEMATVYLEELMAVQPQGPYYLAGYCGGGWIAFEMALRLRRAGHEVALLALLDSYGPNMPRTEPRLDESVQKALRRGPAFVTRKIMARLQRDYETVSRTARIKYSRWADGVVPYDLRDVWLTQAFLSAAAHYRPSQYDQKVTLLLAKDVAVPAGAEQTQYGWAGLAAGGLAVFRVPGTHFTLTEDPNVAALAARLAGCMDEARKNFHLIR